MNVSLAHLTDSCIAHALEVAEQPLTATHDNARAVYPHPRNFSDDQLRAMARNGGVVGIHFLKMMCNPQRLLLDDYLDHVEHVAGWPGTGTSASAGWARTRASGLRREPRQQLPWRGGRGAPGDAGGIPNASERLAGRGWSEGQIGGFVGGNYLRVLGEVLPAGR